MVKLERVQVKSEVDTSPDLSYLGEFTDKWSPGCIDRRKRGHTDRAEYRYWAPGPNHYPHTPESWAHVSDEDKARVIAEHGSLAAADAAYLEADYLRHEAFASGEFTLIGIWAEASIVIYPGGPNRGVSQVIGTGGLWGIEDDSDDSYFREVAGQELTALRDLLGAIGCDLPDDVPVESPVRGVSRTVGDILKIEEG